MDRFRRLSITLGCLDILLGLAVAVGWCLRQQDILQILPFSHPMPFVAAIGFVAIGLGFVGVSARQRSVAIGFSGVVLVFSAVTLTQQVFDLSPGVAYWLASLLPPGNPALAKPLSSFTAVCFVLLASSLLLFNGRGHVRYTAVSVLNGMAALGGLGVLVAYVWDLSLKTIEQSYQVMTPTTAVGILLASGAGLLLAQGIERDRSAKPPWLGIGAPLTVVALAFLVWQALILEQHRQSVRTLDAVAYGAREFLQQRIESDIGELVRLARAGKAEGATYLKRARRVLAIAWMDTGLQNQTVLPATSAGTISGVLDGKRRKGIRVAIDAQKITLSKPFALSDGSPVSLISVPIYREGRCSGALVAVYRLDRLMRAFTEELGSGYTVAVVSDTAIGKVNRGREQSSDNTVTGLVPLTVHETTWVLRVIPASGTLQHFMSPLPRLIFLTGILVAVAFGGFYYNEQRIQAARRLLEEEIAERRTVEEALRRSEARLIEAQSIARIGFWEYDVVSEEVFWSKEMFPLLKVGPDDTTPTLADLVQRFHPDDVPSFLAVVEDAVRTGEPYEFDIRVFDAEGTVLWFHNIGRVVKDAKNRTARLQGTFYDITERKRAEREQDIAKLRLEEANETLRQKQRELLLANERLRQLATTDGLTGLKNHRTFQTRLKVEFDRAIRYTAPLSVLLIDVDSFKMFNDSFGHPAGDEVLVQVAQLLEQTCRSSDLVARYGGEEFAILLPETEIERALEVAERIRSLIAAQPWENRPITVSIGLATVRSDVKSASELVSAADMALYASKYQGRNRVTSYADIGDFAPIEKPERLMPSKTYRLPKEI